LKKNRDQWSSLVPDYQIRMEEGKKVVERQNEIIEEAKSESEESSTSNEPSSEPLSLSEFEEENKRTTDPLPGIDFYDADKNNKRKSKTNSSIQKSSICSSI